MRSDEAMRQHMRLMRKAMRESGMSQIEARIKEHEDAVERGLRTIEEMRQQASAMQQQAQTIMVDIERRRGALLELRQLAGLPLDGSPPREERRPGGIMDAKPTEANSVGRDAEHAG